MSHVVLNCALLVVLGVASMTDLRRRRVPNALTLPAIAFGLLLNLVLFGLDGLRDSAQGAGLGFLMLFGFFVLRWMGAGDVKLMAAVGALQGVEFVYYAALWGAVFGGLFALVGLLRSRRLGLAIAHLYYSRLMPQVGGSFISAWRLPYAPAITLGSLLVLQGVRWIPVGI